MQQSEYYSRVIFQNVTFSLRHRFKLGAAMSKQNQQVFSFITVCRFVTLTHKKHSYDTDTHFLTLKYQWNSVTTWW